MDELPEFHRDVLESLRQPLEDGTINVTRMAGSCSFPAKSLLLAAMNPCPCGYLADSKRACTCTSHQIKRYISKISGPILDTSGHRRKYKYLFRKRLKYLQSK